MKFVIPKDWLLSRAKLEDETTPEFHAWMAETTIARELGTDPSRARYMMILSTINLYVKVTQLRANDAPPAGGIPAAPASPMTQSAESNQEGAITDTQRLDFMDKFYGRAINRKGDTFLLWDDTLFPRSIREAIDAAMRTNTPAEPLDWFGKHREPIITPSAEPAPISGAFQSRVLPWLLECFGQEIANDQTERNHRFVEEAMELAQSCGCSASEAHQLVDYVYSRPTGQKGQEVGGVMVTLAALCLSHGLDMHDCGETELARIWTKVEKIRAKQAAKPKHSPLPEEPAPAASTETPPVFYHWSSSEMLPMANGAWIHAQKYLDLERKLRGAESERDEAVRSIDAAFKLIGRVEDWLATPREELLPNAVRSITSERDAALARVAKLEGALDKIANPRRGLPEEFWNVEQIGDFARAELQ